MPNTTVIVRWPLYQQVAELLQEKILSGSLQGSLPTEEELCEQMNVSRVTIRKAMAELKNKGLIRSYRGRGTFVSTDIPRIHTRVLKIASYYSNPDLDIQHRIYKGFEKCYPELKIEPMFCADSLDYCDFLTGNLDGRSSPDIFMFSESQLPYLVARGIFKELDTGKFTGKGGSFFSRPFELFSKNKSKLYGVPFIFSPLALFVNKAFIDAKEITAFAGWKELIAEAKKIQKINSSGYGFLLPYETLNRWPLFLLQNGVKIIGGKGKYAKCFMDSPEAIKTISWLQDLLYREKVTAGLCPDSTELFMEGMGAILLSSLYMLNKFDLVSGLEWEVLPIPTPSTGVANMLMVTGFGISKSCSDVDGAEQFLTYMLSRDVQDLLAEENVACPQLKTSVSKLTPRIQTHLTEILDPEILKRSVLFSDHPETGAIRQIMQIEMNKVWMGFQSPRDGCLNTSQKINKCIFDPE